MSEYFFVSKCPVGGCSPQSWKNAAVWGWSKEECHQQLVHHLMSSGFHEMDAGDAEIMAEGVEMGQDTWAQPPPKRPKLIAAPPKSMPPTITRDQVTDLVRQEVSNAMGGSSVGTGSSVGPDITIARADYCAVIDSMNRAILAVQQAARVSASASAAFEGEATVLVDIRDTLAAIGEHNDRGEGVPSGLMVRR